MVTNDKLQRHVLRKSLGSFEGSLLVDWLNQRKRTSDHARIERLLENLAVLFTFKAEGSPEGIAALLQEFRGFFGLPRKTVVAMRQAAKEVQKELARYRMRPVLRSLERGTKATEQSLEFDWDPGNAPAGVAVLWIMSLGGLGLVQRVRRCKHCKRWFYGTISTQTFCSTKCQQADYKSSPAWHQHRKEYMRRYRMLKKSGSVKWQTGG